jgi:uncharacterized membrane protein
MMADVQPVVRNSNAALVAHAVYGIYAFSAISAASMIGVLLSFVGIVGVILAHVYRGDVRGTWLESHFTWLIKTFWWSVLWAGLAWIPFVTLIGIPISVAMWGIVFVWVAYRIIRGWIHLFQDQAI